MRHNGGSLIGVDLFAGAGGMSLGFEQAGFNVAASVEYDPVHCSTHEFVSRTVLRFAGVSPILAGSTSGTILR